MITRKTAQEISDEIISQLETNFNTHFPLLRGFSRKVAVAIGQKYSVLQKFGEDVLLQVFVKTAKDLEIDIGVTTINPLRFWGELVGIYKKPGQRAERTVSVSVITTGGTLSAGEQLINPVNQVTYQTVSDVTLSSATVSVQIRANSVGLIGNVDAGTVLHFRNAPDDVEKEVTVSPTESPNGTDPETSEEYRERVLERWLAWPRGGAMADYKLWAENVEDVKNAYPYSGWTTPAIPNSRAGQVFVYVESYSGSYGDASAYLRGLVEDYIEGVVTDLPTRRNINAYVRAFSIERRVFDVEVIGMASDDTETRDAARTDVETSLSQYFLEREPGGQTWYTIPGPRKDIVSVSEAAGVAARASTARGLMFTNIIIRESSTVTPLVYLEEGQKARLGTVTWS